MRKLVQTAALVSAILVAGCAALAGQPPAEDRSEIFIIYKGETPVGYSFTTLSHRAADAKLPERWMVESDILVRVSVDGRVFETHQSSNETISRDYKLLKMFRHSTLGKDQYKLWAEKRGDNIAVTARGPGGEKKSVQPYPEGTVPLSAVPFYLAEHGLDATGTLPVLNSSHVAVYPSSLSISAKPPEPFVYAGDSLTVRRVETRLEGVQTIYKMDDSGNIYEAVQPMLDLTQKRVEIIDLYTVGGWLPWNLSRSTLLAPVVKVKDPEKILWMDIELDWTGAKGVKPDLESEGQTVVSGRVGGFALVHAARVPVTRSKHAAVDKDEVQACLGGDDTGLASITALEQATREAVGGATAPLDIAWSVSNWIHDNITADPATRNNSIAPEVTLDNRAGTDKHAAVLFAAMARTRQVPVRLCFGKLFTMGLFVTHYWVEVYDGVKWIPIDPTAAHGQKPMLIKLSSAASLDQLAPVAQKLDKALGVRIKKYGYK